MSIKLTLNRIIALTQAYDANFKSLFYIKPNIKKGKVWDKQNQN